MSMEAENEIFEYKSNHHGRNLRRIRRASDMKQDVLATIMGLSQTQISTYKQRSVINDKMIVRFAKALNAPPELIKQVEGDPVTVIIENNTFTCSEGGIGNLVGENINHNNPDPVDRIIELANEKTALYERIVHILSSDPQYYRRLNCGCFCNCFIV